MVGSLLFGVGWALTGTCPGTALAQIGEGRLMGLFTVVGILAGAALHNAVVRWRPALFATRAQSGVSGP